MASMPRARAPLTVAMRNTWCALTAAALLAIHFPISAALCISPNIFRSLLLALPSVPSATLTPASSSFCTGQKPLASFILDSGQCTTWAPDFASRLISSSLSCVICTATRLGDTRPSFARRCSGRMPVCLTASSTSCAVSCTCMCIGKSISSHSTRNLSSGASDTV